MTKSHVISGIRWTLITSVIRRSITLILFYFIAKWLSKEDLGIYREYCLILGLFTVVSSLSFDFHYIIEQRQSHTGLIALWQITAIASVTGFIVLNLSSGRLGTLYDSKLLGNLLHFTSIFIIVEIIRRTVRSMAIKYMQFRELALAETYNVIFYSAVTLAALYLYRSIWVYVIVFYLGNALETIYLWNLNRGKISKALGRIFRQRKLLCLSLRHYRSFLTQATLVSVINQFSGNAPILILGMIIEPVYMGIYFFASQLIGVPIGMFTNAINQVFFPVFAGKKDGDIGSMVSRYIRLISYVGIPLLMLFSFIAMYAVNLLFGSKWGDAIPLIPTMVILYGAGLYVTPISGIPFIKRKPGWELIWNTIALIIKAGAMLIGLQTSFITAIWAYAVSGAVMSFVFYFMSMYLIKVNLGHTLRKLLLSFVPFLIYGLFLKLIYHLSTMYAILSAVLGCLILLIVIDVCNKGNLRQDLKTILS